MSRGVTAARNDAGGTLIEVLVSTLLLSVLSAMAYAFARSTLVAVQGLDAQSEVQEVAVIAADVMTRELRLAGFSATAQPLTGLRVAEAERVDVAADLNGDGDTDDTHEVVSYRYDGAARQLVRATAGGAPQAFVTGVPAGGAHFTFHDATGTEVVPAGTGLSLDERRRVRSIGMELTVEIQQRLPDALVPRLVTLSETAHLRNAEAAR